MVLVRRRCIQRYLSRMYRSHSNNTKRGCENSQQRRAVLGILGRFKIIPLEGLLVDTESRGNRTHWNSVSAVDSSDSETYFTSSKLRYCNYGSNHGTEETSISIFVYFRSMNSFRDKCYEATKHTIEFCNF